MKNKKYQLKTGDIIELPIPENYADCLTLVKSDLYRSTGRVLSTMEVLGNLMNPKKVTFMFWYRMCQYHGIFYWLFKVIYKLQSHKRNVILPTQVKAGYGLYLAHAICMVVNEDTIIGNNVNLSQFLNIGTNNERAAIIGDNVYVGPHVSIVEDVHIGSSSTIGAGAVVVKDVPSEATVVGVPAVEKSRKNPARFIVNPYPIR